MKKESTNSNNKKTKLVFNSQKINSLGKCSIGGEKCQGKIVKEITIKNHPCAGRQTICDSAYCLTEARLKLNKKYKENKEIELKSKSPKKKI